MRAERPLTGPAHEVVVPVRRPRQRRGRGAARDQGEAPASRSAAPPAYSRAQCGHRGRRRRRGAVVEVRAHSGLLRKAQVIWKRVSLKSTPETVSARIRVFATLVEIILCSVSVLRRKPRIIFHAPSLFVYPFIPETQNAK